MSPRRVVVVLAVLVGVSAPIVLGAARWSLW